MYYIIYSTGKFVKHSLCYFYQFFKQSCLIVNHLVRRKKLKASLGILTKFESTVSINQMGSSEDPHCLLRFFSSHLVRMLHTYS